MNRLTRDQLVRLAKLGAATRLHELKAEIDAIESLLGPGRGRRRRASTEAPRRRTRKRKRGWTAEQRKAAAERMKSYWAKRKAGHKK